MVIYLEACESGSMFDGILSNEINIYAATAAEPWESSWATYCPGQDAVDGLHIGACLGDKFSTTFLEDIEKRGSLRNETFNDQFQVWKAGGLNSHPVQYGDLSIATQPLSYFMSGFDPEEQPERSQDYESNAGETHSEEAKDTIPDI